MLVPTISELLSNNDITLNDLACIGINRGPGPYNTLRSIITTINGFHFTQKIKFIELEAIPLLLESEAPGTAAILNAFSKRVYYGIKTDSVIIQGISPVSELAELLKDTKQIIGNGITAYPEEIQKLSSNIRDNFPQFNSLKVAVEKTYALLQDKQISSQYITPKYF